MTETTASASPRLALVHEWLASRSGSEKTYEAMAAALPEADLWALSDAMGADLEVGERTIRTTFFDRSSLLSERRELSLPLMPLAWRTVDAGRYDLVVTSSHACAKGFRPARDAVHLCYCYTPMRYVWDAHDRRHPVQALASLGPRQALRRWDRRSARWVDRFAAISTEVATRIERSYGRPSTVIYPPVDTERFCPGPIAAEGLPTEPFVLACSRFVPYKRIDLAIEAAALAGVTIVVAGSGPDEDRLRAVAAAVGADARFEIRPDDDRLRDLYRAASAFAFPAFEDFGIVVVEAQACGTPVVALGRGGAVDTVVPGVTGELVAEEDAAAFAAAFARVVAWPDREATAAACRAHALGFSVDRFQREIRAWVAEAVADYGLQPGAPTTSWVRSGDAGASGMAS